MNRYELPSKRRVPGWKWLLLSGALLGFALFWLAALPLPNSLAQRRARWWASSASSGEASAQVTASDVITVRQPGTEWQMQGSLCNAGSHLSFNGVRLSDPAKPGFAINLVLPEDGQNHLTFETPDGKKIVIPQSGCGLWRVDVHHNSFSSNVTEGQEVHARFDCTADGQLHVSGQVDHRFCE